MFLASNITTLAPTQNISTTPHVRPIFHFNGERLFFSVTLYCIFMIIVVFAAIYIYGQKNNWLHKPGKHNILKKITTEDNDTEIELQNMLPPPPTCGVLEHPDGLEAPGACSDNKTENNDVEYMSTMEETDESDYTS